MGSLGGLELQLEFVRNQRDKFRICGFSLGIGNRVAEEALEGIEVASIPCHFDGMPDCSLYTTRRGLEGFGYLGMVGNSPPRGYFLLGCSKRIDCLIGWPMYQYSIELPI